LTIVTPTWIELAATDGDGLSRVFVVWLAKTGILRPQVFAVIALSGGS
jgi:hypothetical protein